MATRITVTDETDNEHFTLKCKNGCVIRGLNAPDEKLPLTLAAQYARAHAIEEMHDVEIVDAR